MLTCPPYSTDRNERIRVWEASVAQYVNSEPLAELLDLFEASVEGDSLLERTRSLRAFARERWDYRRKAGLKERWTVRDEDPVVLDHEETILRCAKELGMIGAKSQRRDADILMPLGGARAANFDRMKEAKRLADKSVAGVPVVALTAMRPLGEIEIPYVCDCIPDARAGATTEYDVVCRAMELAFGVSETGLEGERFDDQPNLSWALRRFGPHSVVSAPSSEPEKRRANTLDTLRFFHEKFSPTAGSILLLTTSSIYVNYQTASLVPFAIEKGWEIELSGTGEPGKHNDVISNYLQEIKGTVDAVARSIGA